MPPPRPRSPPSPPLRACAPLVAHRQRRGGDTVRRTTRLPRTRPNAFPHVLQWLQENETAIFGAVLRPWPTLTAAPRARRTTRAHGFQAHDGRAADLIQSRMEARKSAGALPTDDGGSAPHALLGQARVAPRRVTLPALADFAHALAPRAQTPPACPWLDAWPGAGAVWAPRLRVACGAPRARDAAAEARPTSAGMAPVPDRSGTQAWGHGRLQGPTFRRHTWVAWAAQSTRQAFWAQVSDQPQRATGTAPQAAGRAVPGTWMRLRSRGWQARTPYEASGYRHALNRRRAPLLHHVAPCV